MNMALTILGALTVSYWITRLCVRLDGGKW